jgi:hypothetical protein
VKDRSWGITLTLHFTKEEIQTESMASQRLEAELRKADLPSLLNSALSSIPQRGAETRGDP